jgi:hypothetical protein
MNRELIYSALWALLADTPGFKTRSRRIVHWNDVAPADQPALFMQQVSELPRVQTGLPSIWTFNVNLYLYANTEGSLSLVPATVLNPLVDAVLHELAAECSADAPQTLGGLVHRCGVEGSIQTDEGALGDQGVVIIPIAIIVPEESGC